MNDPCSSTDLFKNVAGRVNSDSTKAILFTLQRSFGQCRVLHDILDDQPDLVNKFVNLVCLTVLTWSGTLNSMVQVFFCSPSTKPLSFRSPTESDYAGSHLRAMIFDTLQKREVDMSLIRGDTKDGEKWVLNDTSNRLMDWQKSEALEHWRGTCLRWLSMFPTKRAV